MASKKNSRFIIFNDLSCKFIVSLNTKIEIMKKNILTAVLFSAFTTLSITTLSSFSYTNSYTKSISLNLLSKDEIIKGLKDALNISIENSVKQSSALDGFWKNPLITLPFPADAQKIKDAAIKLKMKSQVDRFEMTLNRAAEEATKKALPIFLNSIKNMNISDGLAILNGGNGSATRFLQNATSGELKTAFRPEVDKAIQTVELTKYWAPLATNYNKVNVFTGGKSINPDLNGYVTERAISGLFKLVEIEENKIRKDPNAAVTGITNTATEAVTKVFGSILKGGK